MVGILSERVARPARGNRSARGVDRCLRRLQADAGAVPVGLDGVESPALGDHLEFGCAQLWERGRGRVGCTGWKGGT